MYNILVQCGIPVELVRLIEMCLNEMYSGVRVGRHLSDMFLIKNVLKQSDTLLPLPFICALQYALMRVQVNQDGLKLKLIELRHVSRSECRTKSQYEDR